MRITRRTSGGRGEYEISEQAPNGLSPNDLLQRRVTLDLGRGWTFDAAVRLTSQGGKRRLRMVDPGGIQIHRQIAAALLMPHSVRADEALGRGMPIMQAERYAIEHIEIAEAELIEPGRVRLLAGDLILRNLSHHAEQLGLADRLAKLEHVWLNRAELPESIAAVIEEHRALTRSGHAIPEAAEKLVQRIQLAVTEMAVDLGILYRSEGQDALPDLVASLGEPPAEPPLKVDQVDPDETEIKRRTVKEWRRWAASRGAASARFRQAVRRAWRSTCAVCGWHLPPTSLNSSAGVDAAHILPWSDYDLDHPSNGICLCKHHHWAFDEGLIVVRCEGGAYSVEVPAGVAEKIAGESAAFSLDSLTAFAGAIPAGRLPASLEDRPSPKYLELLRESSE